MMWPARLYLVILSFLGQPPYVGTHDPAQVHNNGSSSFTYQNKTYVLNESKLIWQLAREQCELQHGRLASTDVMTKHYKMAAFLSDLRVERVWLGGRSEELGYGWVGKDDNVSYHEPTSGFWRHASDTRGRSMCGYLQRKPESPQHKLAIEMTSSTCDIFRDFVCEFDVHCPDDDTATSDMILGNKCFAFMLDQGQVTWYDAKEQCERRGGHLASLEGTIVQREISRHLLKASSASLRSAWSLWVAWANIKWRWINGGILLDYQQAWGHGGALEEGGCIASQRHAGDVYLWHAQDCRLLYPSVCEHDTPGEGVAEGYPDTNTKWIEDPGLMPLPEPTPIYFDINILNDLDVDAMILRGPYILLGFLIGFGVLLIPVTAMTYILCRRPPLAEKELPYATLANGSVPMAGSSHSSGFYLGYQLSESQLGHSRRLTDSQLPSIPDDNTYESPYAYCGPLPHESQPPDVAIAYERRRAHPPLHGVVSIAPPGLSPYESADFNFRGAF